jgi:glyoxylase-like metal-dependent hydrolase (beta-lactamase superfamily II)
LRQAAHHSEALIGESKPNALHLWQRLHCATWAQHLECVEYHHASTQVGECERRAVEPARHLPWRGCMQRRHLTLAERAKVIPHAAIAPAFDGNVWADTQVTFMLDPRAVHDASYPTQPPPGAGTGISLLCPVDDGWPVHCRLARPRCGVILKRGLATLIQSTHRETGMAFTHGIHTIDTDFVRPQFDAAYLIVENGRGAFIDCGTNFSVPRMLAALNDAGLTPTEVDWLILTHVHLDHAGGAGELMAQLPNAKLVVHPRGARHMIDPSTLWAGASAVYGEAVMEQTYGRLRPIPSERVVEAQDGHVVDLAGRPLRCLDTPGHAKHHLTVYDARANVCFTGDVFGLSYRDFDTANGPFILPTTSPVQFDPPALHASINRLLALQPAAMYLTHYGRVEHVERLAADLHAQIDAMVVLARSVSGNPDRHTRLMEALTDLYAGRAAAHGWSSGREALHQLLGMDIELNAQGLEIWLDHQPAV